MQVFFVANYGRKLYLAAAILMFWLLMLLAADLIIKNSLLFNLSIDNCMDFSYPYGIVIDNVFVSESADEQSIQSSYTFSVPVTKGFSNYKSLEGKFSFDYPSAFILQPQVFQGSDIMYHIDFRNKADTTHGFVQVWSMTGSLYDFLKNSKSLSTQTFKYFKEGSITVNGLPGYFWDYMVLSNGSYIKAMEVFLKQDEKMYRISYFVPENEWDKHQLELYRNIVKSFRIN